MKQKKKNKQQACQSISKLTTALSVAVTFATAQNGLKMARFRNETTNTLNYGLSLMGGAEIMIDGTGFDDTPQSNLITFGSHNTGFSGMTLDGPTLTQEDEFSSNPNLGRLAFTTPSISELFRQPHDFFNGQQVGFPNGFDPAVYMELKVMNMRSGEHLACATLDHCRVHFDTNYTPILYDVVPSQVYFDQVASFVLNPLYAEADLVLRPDMPPVQDIKIDGSLVDFEGLIDSSTRIGSWQLGAYNARIGDQQSGNDQNLRVRFRVGDALIKESAQHCTFDGSECWKVRTHPSISQLSASQGYSTGGELLTITGHGFGQESTPNNVQVNIDGIPCLVESVTADTVRCFTGAQPNPAPVQSQPGSPGLSRTEGGTQTLSTSFENNMSVKMVNNQAAFDGWFKAPATGMYRFYISADDNGKLMFDSATPYSRAAFVAPNTVEIAKSKGWDQWRGYYGSPEATETFVSSWISLTQGEFYKIGGTHWNSSGKSHYTVSMEFEQLNTAGHPNAAPEVQHLEIAMTNTFETWTLRVDNPDNGNFMIKFLIPDTNPPQFWDSDYISADASAWGLQSVIQNYWRHKFGSNIEVVKQSFDVAGVETQVPADIVSSLYTITVRKLQPSATFSLASAIAGSSTATFELKTPVQNQSISSTPLSGKYIIQCPSITGQIYETVPLSFNTWDNFIELEMLKAMPELFYKVSVRDNNKYSYKENGVSFSIVFESYNGDPPQCTIISDPLEPIVGNLPTFQSTTPRPYGEYLFFEPIPLEMLYTDAQYPQVSVVVNGIESVCPAQNCDFEYIAGTGEIMNQSLQQKSLTITGMQFPSTPSSADYTIRFADSVCDPTTISVSAQQITCDLETFPKAGDWIVDVQLSLGRIFVAPSVAAINVPLQVTALENVSNPGQPLNQLGGEFVKLTGSGFSLIPNEMAVEFADQTKCWIDLAQSSDTEVVCEVDGFDLATLGSFNYIIDIVLSMGSVQGTSPGPFDVATSKIDSLSVSPATVSPVVRQELTINVGALTNTGALASEFTATLVSQADPTVQRQLYVKSFTETNWQFVVVFPGAMSGLYWIRISHANMGRIDMYPLQLTVESKVLALSHQSGSLLGGTVLTIDGTNFSSDPLDNPVKVGDHQCNVESSTPTQIKCRIAATGITDLTTTIQTNVIVFLRTQEEAQWSVPQTFSFVPPTMTITGPLSLSYDTAQMANIASVPFTGPTPGSVAEVSVLIDGKEQTITSVSNNQLQFRVENLAKVAQNSLQISFGEGSPISQLSTFTDSVTFQKTSQVGWQAGGIILTIDGTGFTQDQAVQVLHVPTQTEICKTFETRAYGQFSCITKGMPIDYQDELKLVVDGQQYACASPQMCQIEQMVLQSPTITQIVLVHQSEIRIVGTDFPGGNPPTTVIFNGVSTTAITSQDTTSVVASFPTGVPPNFSSYTTEIYWRPDPTQFISAYNVNDFVLDVPFNLNMLTGSSGVQVSWLGGLPYTISYPGLSSTLAAASQSSDLITVCGVPCPFDASLSDSNFAVCTLPEMKTRFSVNEYMLAEDSPITSGYFVGSAPQAELAKLQDKINTINMSDPTPAQCWFGQEFNSQEVGILTEAKFFVADLTDKSPFENGNLKLQGWTGGQWADLWLVDSEVHSGWNIKKFDPSSLPAHSMYRFEGAQAGSCNVSEFQLIGVVALDDASPIKDCNVELTLGGVTHTLDPVSYMDQMTPTMSGMNNRFGSVLGGDLLVLQGALFSATASDNSVLIDNRICSVIASGNAYIECTTSDKPYVAGLDPSLEIVVAGKGRVATMGHLFRYVSLWSDETTWNDILPIEGQAISIPKGQHLLVDVDSTPKLSFVVVEGSLIFPSNADPLHERTFDASYVMVQGGYLEIGTEADPYTSKLTITMHSSVTDPYLPIYGNKVIGVRFGQLEMHGKPRSVTWSELMATASVGDTQIELVSAQANPLDWEIGEEIVIASTDYEGRHAEQRTIVGITGLNSIPVITLDRPLEYKHFAGVETFGADSIEMRAEVGLLSRNVRYRGDPETSAKNQYGAHIMVHSPGDESAVGRIENVEFTDCGQAFKLGRYPIHFHMIGTVNKSYIKNNAIHQTYNRAITIHGVHYLTIQNNVAYKNMGHAVFIEDAAETNNLVEDNLVLDTRRSWSLLNTDQTPASFWITHPNNIFRRNHAAGSDRYSYWYDTQVNAMGPSFDLNVCPENSKIGEFVDNVAHSNGRYGLRIFHNLIPREKPCAPFVYSGDPSNPYPDNQPIMAEFRNLISYKNKRNGAIAERVGAVQFINFKTADNILAGIEFSLTEDIIDGYAKIVGGLVVGRTSNTESWLDAANPHGVITPRTENFTVDGVKFYNFDFNDAAALGTCSHCFHNAATDSGARTVTVQNLYLDPNTVLNRIRYQSPWRAIFLDKTGELTDNGPNSWATPYWKHNEWPECTNDPILYGGLVCDSTIQVRRVAIYGMAPNIFVGMNIKITQFLDVDEQSMSVAGTLQDYLDDPVNYSVVAWKEKLKPMHSWTLPYVTGKRYRFHFEEGLDWTQMRVTLSERWETTDHDTFFQTNFTDVREAVNFTDVGDGHQHLNETLNTNAPSNLQTGDNWVRNDTADRLIDFVVNGKNETRNDIKINGYRCALGVCDLGTVQIVQLEDRVRYWSNILDWDNLVDRIPIDGDSIIIPSGWNMMIDVAETALLESLEINGRLTFYQRDDPTTQSLPDLDVTLRSKSIWVRAGELIAGSANEPFRKKAKIVLHGNADDETIKLSNGIEVHNKVLVNTNVVRLYGQQRSRDSRLRLTALKGQDLIYVDPNLDWQQGEKIYLAPSNMNHLGSDYRTIMSYDSGSGMLYLDRPLDFYHFGGDSTANDYSGVDMRAEVVLLDRNVVIEGTDEDNWGGQIVTTDLFEFDGSWRKGTTFIDSAEVRSCSHRQTPRACVRWDGAIGADSALTNSVVHQAESWLLSITKSNNVQVRASSFIGGKAIGASIDFVRNVKIDSVYVFDVNVRTFGSVNNMTEDILACFAYCSQSLPDIGSPCYETSVTNSIVAGCHYTGFTAPGNDCDATDATIQAEQKFFNNTAHSVKGSGAIIYPDPVKPYHASKCYSGGDFRAYKVTQAGVENHFVTKEMQLKNVVLIDNQLGVSLSPSHETALTKGVFTDSIVYGEPANMNVDCPGDQDLYCYCPKHKGGFMSMGNNMRGKEIHITASSKKPMHKVKSEANWAGIAHVDNVHFKDFRGQTRCGGLQSVFFRNHYASDVIPLHTLENIRFTDIEDSALAWLEDPDRRWAKIDDCGDFPCTAPLNWVLNFKFATFLGTTPSVTKTQFSLISDNPGASEKINRCQFGQSWNMWLCQNDNVGLLTFESLDGDSYDRSVQPVNLTRSDGFINTLNSNMDHVWDGFYTGQTRLSRFPSLIETGKEYNVTMTGTPPGKMRYTLQASAYEGVKLSIPYPNAGSYSVKANGVHKEYTPWDSAINRASELTKMKGCGENRFVGVENVLEFYLTPGCEITVQPKDTLLCAVRLDWTLDEFYASGGVTRFADRVAAILGVASSQIKTVAVYQGSVIIDFFVETLVDIFDEQSAPIKEVYKAALKSTLEQNASALGAPILGVVGDEENLFGEPIPPPNYTQEEYSAIVRDGDKNLWDKHVVTQGDQPIEQAEKSSSADSQNEKTIKPQVVTKDRFGSDDKLEKTKRLVALVAIVVAILLILVVVCTIQRCHKSRNMDVIIQERQKVNEKIRDEELREVQYVLETDPACPNIFEAKSADKSATDEIVNMSNLKDDSSTVIMCGSESKLKQDMSSSQFATDSQQIVVEGQLRFGVEQAAAHSSKDRRVLKGKFKLAGF